MTLFIRAIIRMLRNGASLDELIVEYEITNNELAIIMAHLDGSI